VNFPPLLHCVFFACALARYESLTSPLLALGLFSILMLDPSLFATFLAGLSFSLTWLFFGVEISRWISFVIPGLSFFPSLL